LSAGLSVYLEERSSILRRVVRMQGIVVRKEKQLLLVWKVWRKVFLRVAILIRSFLFRW